MRRLAIVLLLVMSSACGRGSSGSAGDVELTLSQAAARLRQLIDTTADEVLPGRPRQVSELSTGRKNCGSDGRQDEDYDLIINVGTDQIDAAIERTRRYWESLGYEVQAEGEGTDIPRLYIRFDGFNAGLEANKQDGKAGLGGSTPCLPAGG